MIATFALLLLVWQEPDASASQPPTELVAGDDERVLAEARDALERVDAAPTTGEPESAREEVELVIELLAPLPSNEAVASLLRDAGERAIRMGHYSAAHEAWSRVVIHHTPHRCKPLDRARAYLARSMRMMGDPQGALPFIEAALAALERRRPESHPDLYRMRTELADTLYDLGEYERAVAVYEALVGMLERSSPAGHNDLLRARLDLTRCLQATGDHEAARALSEAVIDALEKNPQEDRGLLLWARRSLAVSLRSLGDLYGSRALLERGIEDSEKTVSANDSDLLDTKYVLAVTMTAMREYAEARSLLAEVLDAYTRLFPENHPMQSRIRRSLAVVMDSMGDHLGARALLETVLEAREQSLPAGHEHIFEARRSLALTMRGMGDLRAARALQEQSLAWLERTKPEGHPSLLAARSDLARTMKSMGHLFEARALQEMVLEAREQGLPDGHPDLYWSRHDTAETRMAMGDIDGARQLLDKIHEVRERSREPEDPEVLDTCTCRAMAMHRAGEHEAARTLITKLLENRERALPDGDPAVLEPLAKLALILRALGEDSAARELGRRLVRGMLERLETVILLSPREAREATASMAPLHAAARTLTEPTDPEAPDTLRFDLAETLRAIGAAPRETGSHGDPRHREVEELRERLNDLVSGGRREGQSAASFKAAITRLTIQRDRLLREIRASSSQQGRLAGVVRAEEVAGALETGAVAVGFMRLNVRQYDTDAPGVVESREFFVSHVLLPDGSLIELELGPADELEELVRAWRAALGKPVERGLSPEAGADGERESGEALRARVLDPILAVLPDGTTTFHVCVDDVLHLVSLESLPLGDERVRDRYRLVHEVSFERLTRDDPLSESGAGLLAMGGVRFDSAPENPRALAGNGTRGARPETFPPLLQTRIEAEAVELLFDEVHTGESIVLSREGATKATFHELAPGKRYIHVATHGWFAPETIKSTLDPEPFADRHWTPSTAEQTVTGLAPMTLCGLAFAGANADRDSLGRVPGIMSAEELAGIDLSACELAVLSACETNVGIRRAGQGIQSLQTALHAAGARAAITSLWRVDDAATRKLMERFYTYLWVEEMGKADALWKAKCDLRAEGHPVRDWAAWVLSGDPD